MSEMRFATWAEIDGDVWEIPANRMKMRKAHRVPLSPRAVAILKNCAPSIPNHFPGLASGSSN